MAALQEILAYNKNFVEMKQYEPFSTSKYPDKRFVILSCMDTRLVELLPKAMNVKNGDVKIVKSAGAIINHPFGGIMRSILVAIYALQADEVFVIGHYDCGMSGVDPEVMINAMKERGISEETIETVRHSGVNIEDYLKGFDDVTDNVRHSVNMIRKHPLVAKSIPVHGLVIDPATGRLDLVAEGYAE